MMLMRIVLQTPNSQTNLQPSTTPKPGVDTCTALNLRSQSNASFPADARLEYLHTADLHQTPNLVSLLPLFITPCIKSYSCRRRHALSGNNQFDRASDFHARAPTSPYHLTLFTPYILTMYLHSTIETPPTCYDKLCWRLQGSASLKMRRATNQNNPDTLTSC